MRRTNISGFVFLPRMSAIRLLRSIRLSVSMKSHASTIADARIRQCRTRHRCLLKLGGEDGPQRSQAHKDDMIRHLSLNMRVGATDDEGKQLLGGLERD